MSSEAIRLFRVNEKSFACYMSSDGKMQFGVRDDYPDYRRLPLYVDVHLEFPDAASEGVSGVPVGEFVLAA